MAILFTNNASATIASTISSSATSITVASGQGAEFPVLTGADYFIATLVDTSNNIEIIKVTARSSDTMTVVRAQESTAARSYTAGSLLELRVTAATLNSFAQTSSITTQPPGTNNTSVATTAFVQAAIQTLYPVGSIYTSTVATNPNTLFGFGTWTAFGAGRVMVGAGTLNSVVYTAAATGGSADAVLVSHNHGGATGGQNQNHVHVVAGTTGGQSNSHNHSTLEPSGGTYQNVGGNFGSDYNLASYGSTPNVTYVTGGASVNHTHTFSTTSNANNVDHTHSIATDGSSATNANMQPYVVVYMWNRTA